MAISVIVYNIAKYCMHFVFYETSHHRYESCKKKCGFEQKYK